VKEDSSDDSDDSEDVPKLEGTPAEEYELTGRKPAGEEDDGLKKEEERELEPEEMVGKEDSEIELAVVAR